MKTNRAKPRIHIGHHFFGAGNIGDDLMLAGFVSAIGPAAALSCAIPFDRASQSLRFPEIQWLAYEAGVRANAIDSCDAWVGVGDTPFQRVVGDWFYDHLAAELRWCQRYQKPMYFVGVGVNERSALDHPVARAVLAYASHVWTRDGQSARWLGEHCASGKVTESADLAHIWLSRHTFDPPRQDQWAYVLNFEQSAQWNPHAFTEWAGASRCGQHWLVQEVRKLPGSELDLFETLSQQAHDRLELKAPDYASGSVGELIRPWGSPGLLLSSRYHAAVVGAWSGARVVAICRSDKIRGLVEQLGVSTGSTFTDVAEIGNAVEKARPVPRDRLDALAKLATVSCRDLVQRILAQSGGSRTESAMPNRSTLASVIELESPLFAAFMRMMNAFASTFGLRTFTNWSKVWEYPWLWHAGLSGIDWRGARVVDLGSEISPMPWFLATLGAQVRLLEVDPKWAPTWEALRETLRVDVTWDIVQNESIPLPDGWADVVTSLSVIEHQPDKSAAVDEVVRVLRPGGLFAVSFDICQPEMGMTFPAWNGKALTADEFDRFIWRHPAFGNWQSPQWDWSVTPAFRAWHLQSAEHHNYVVGAAVLWKT